MSNTEPNSIHSVRWATRTVGRKPFDTPRWTRWHLSADSCRTLCGLVIVIGTEACFLPDTDEPGRADCPRCSKRLRAIKAGDTGGYSCNQCNSMGKVRFVPVTAGKMPGYRNCMACNRNGRRKPKPGHKPYV